MKTADAFSSTTKEEKDVATTTDTKIESLYQLTLSSKDTEKKQPKNDDDCNADDHNNNIIKRPKTKEERLAEKALKKAAKHARIERRTLRLANRTTVFPGRHKWLGGAVDSQSGKIYGVPSHSHHVLCLTPPCSSECGVGGEVDGEEGEGEKTTVELIPLPNHLKAGSFKWLRGVITNGYLYGIPAWSTNGILKVRLQEKTKGIKGPRVKLLPLPRPSVSLPDDDNNNDYDDDDSEPDGTEGNNSSGVDRSRWMWHGGTLGRPDENNSNSNNQSIYCIPSNAKHVLKVNTVTDEVTEIGPSFEGKNKWYGGIKGRDGCIYGMPYTAKGVIRICPKTDEVEVLGDYPVGGWKWHGGLISHSTGVIYAFPAHANEVLCVDTNIDTPLNDAADQSWRVYTIPVQKGSEDDDRDDLKYKWLGGSYGADGCIYGMPSDATSILRIDPITNTAITFGKVSAKINKWQGGVLSKIDKCVYAMPADMDCVLRIDTDPDHPLKVEMIGDLGDVEDKWQGGFQAEDGTIYAIPENMDRIMKLTPGSTPCVEFLS